MILNRFNTKERAPLAAGALGPGALMLHYFELFWHGEHYFSPKEPIELFELFCRFGAKKL